MDQVSGTLRVPVVTSLFVRRQLRRDFDLISMSTLMTMFPHLKSLTNKSWARPDLMSEMSDIMSNSSFFLVVIWRLTFDH